MRLRRSDRATSHLGRALLASLVSTIALPVRAQTWTPRSYDDVIAHRAESRNIDYRDFLTQMPFVIPNEGGVRHVFEFHEDGSVVHTWGVAGVACEGLTTGGCWSTSAPLHTQTGQWLVFRQAVPTLVWLCHITPQNRGWMCIDMRIGRSTTGFNVMTDRLSGVSWIAMMPAFWNPNHGRQVQSEAVLRRDLTNLFAKEQAFFAAHGRLTLNVLHLTGFHPLSTHAYFFNPTNNDPPMLGLSVIDQVTGVWCFTDDDMQPRQASPEFRCARPQSGVDPDTVGANLAAPPPQWATAFDR